MLYTKSSTMREKKLLVTFGVVGGAILLIDESYHITVITPESYSYLVCKDRNDAS